MEVHEQSEPVLEVEYLPAELLETSLVIVMLRSLEEVLGRFLSVRH